jgi:hypothetical protein
MAYAFIEHTFGLLGRGSQRRKGGVALCQIGEIITGGYVEERIADTFLGMVTLAHLMQSLLCTKRNLSILST